MDLADDKSIYFQKPSYTDVLMRVIRNIINILEQDRLKPEIYSGLLEMYANLYPKSERNKIKIQVLKVKI